MNKYKAKLLKEKQRWQRKPLASEESIALRGERNYLRLAALFALTGFVEVYIATTGRRFYYLTATGFFTGAIIFWRQGRRFTQLLKTLADSKPKQPPVRAFGERRIKR